MYEQSSRLQRLRLLGMAPVCISDLRESVLWNCCIRPSFLSAPLARLVAARSHSAFSGLGSIPALPASPLSSLRPWNKQLMILVRP